jgi:ABC-type antimicrobial peptide transport system permease subunit
VNVLNIKLSERVAVSTALSKVEAVLKKYNPQVPFDYNFVDQSYAKKFDFEERIGKLAIVFTVLALIISCLGLFALASYVAEQRTIEIGIRKVVGATITNLWHMLSKDFLVLVLISCFIAVPISFITWINGCRITSIGLIKHGGFLRSRRYLQ